MRFALVLRAEHRSKGARRPDADQVAGGRGTPLSDAQ